MDKSLLLIYRKVGSEADRRIERSAERTYQQQMTLEPTGEHSQWRRCQGSLPGSPCVARLRRDAPKRPGSNFYRDEPSEPLKITAGPTSFSGSTALL